MEHWRRNTVAYNEMMRCEWIQSITKFYTTWVHRQILFHCWIL